MWTNTSLTSLALSELPALEELWAAGCTSLQTLKVGNNPKMKGALRGSMHGTCEYIRHRRSISSISLEGCTKLQVFQRDYSVNVPGEKPTITTESLPDAYIGDVYSAYVRASSSTNAPIRYRISAIPTDWSKSFSCSTTGTISGMFTGTPPSGGTINITIAASNYVGSGTKTFKLAIKTRAVAPTITTTSLPDGKVGESYSAQVTAAGTTPITLELNSTALANGLNINSSK